MKILRLFTVMMIAAITFAACDDTTENIGGSITNNVDNINISNAVFDVATNSLVAGPVLNGYIRFGRLHEPVWRTS